MSVLFLLGCAVSSLGNLLTGLAWTLAAAFTLQLLRGVGLSAMDVGVNTVVQRQVPAAMTGRDLALNDSVDPDVHGAQSHAAEELEGERRGQGPRQTGE